MKNERETKELSFFDERPDTVKPVEEPNNKKPEAPKEPSGGSGNNDNKHSIYEEKEKPKKGWANHKVKWGVIGGVTAALALGLGLGLGLGLNRGGGRNDSIAGPWDDDDIIDWVGDKIKTTDVKVARLEDKAIIWAFEGMGDDGEEIYGDKHIKRRMERAEDSADDRIKNSKDDYRKSHGSKWRDEWIQYLIDQGFDSEDEYRDSLIASEIESEIAKVYTVDTWIRRSATENSSIKDGAELKYFSEVTRGSTNNPRFEYIVNSKVDRDGGSDGGSKFADVEFYLKSYIELEKPMSFVEMNIPWTYGNENDPMKQDRIVLGSNDDVEEMWRISRDVMHNHFETDPEEKDWDLVSEGNSGNLVTLDSLNSNEEVRNSILQTLFNRNYKANAEGSKITVEEFAHLTNFAMAKTFDEASSLDWAARPEDWSDNSRPDDPKAAKNHSKAMDAVKISELDFSGMSDHQLRTFNDQFTDVMKPIILEDNKAKLTRTLELDTIRNDRIEDGKQGLMLSFNSNGINLVQKVNYETFDGLKDWNVWTGGKGVEEKLFEDAENLVFDELDYWADQTVAVNNGIKFNREIINGYRSWMNSNYKTIVLNEALNDSNFITDNKDIIETVKPDETKYNTSYLEAGKQEIVDHIYSKLYWARKKNYNELYLSLQDFDEDYGNDIYEKMSYEQIMTDLEDSIVFWKGRENTNDRYVLRPFEDLIKDRSLIGGSDNG